MAIPELIKISAPTASEVSESFTLQPAAEALLTPEQTPTQFLEALQENNLSTDSINFLAHGMPDQEAVGWACQSTEMVSDKLGAAELETLETAQAWVASPSEETAQPAALAASETDYQSPASWAAQAAAWSEQTPALEAAGDIAVPTSLTGDAAAGSVMLAAALSVPGAPEFTAPELPETPSLDLSAPDLSLPELELPEVPALETPSLEIPTFEMSAEQQAAAAEIHQPFIDLGIEIASGQTPVA